MSDYLYFLSYARDDRVNDQHRTIEKFSKELESRVRMLYPGQGNTSFFDGSDIETGDNWPDTLSRALCTSRVFVPIYSPTYFTKDFCGREWQIFSDRLDAYKAQNPAAKVHSLIQPVLLMAPRDLQSVPTAVSDVQYMSDVYPENYRTAGLQAIRRSGAGTASYDKFLTELARRIIEVAKQCPLPASDPCPDITEVANAFRGQGAPMGSVAEEVTKTRGPRYVQFIFVAGKRSELRAIRQSLDCYGEEGGLDWQPFLPPVEDEVAYLAQEIAAKEKLRYETVPVGANIIQQLEDAERKHKLVVVIADTWTLRLEQYRDFTRQYDDRNFLNCIVLVPWNQHDNETASSRALLEQTIKEAFPKKWIMGDPSVSLEPIGSPEDLKKHLSESLHKTRALVMQHMSMRDVKPAKSEQTVTKPVIVGP